MAELYIVNQDEGWEQELVFCKDCVYRGTKDCPIKEEKIFDTFYCGFGEKEY